MNQNLDFSSLLARLRFNESLPTLVQPLKEFSKAVDNEVWALLGKFLPTGSTKFISVLGMLNHLNAQGKLRSCRSLVLSSSGNTALAAAEILFDTGINLHAVIDPRTAPAKLAQLRRWNAEIITVRQPDPVGGWLGARLKKVQDLVRDLPAVDLDQYANPGALAAHYQFTADLLWRALDGRIDVVVSAIGTGGTAGGVFYGLRERNPDVISVAVDAEGSTLFGAAYRDHLLTGIGAAIPCVNVQRAYHSMAGFPPQIIGDQEAFTEAHRLLRHDGISVGGSSGAVLGAARRVARSLKRKRVVVLLPDGGEAYQETIFNSAWLASHGITINSRLN